MLLVSIVHSAPLMEQRKLIVQTTTSALSDVQSTLSKLYSNTGTFLTFNNENSLKLDNLSLIFAPWGGSEIKEAMAQNQLVTQVFENEPVYLFDTPGETSFFSSTIDFAMNRFWAQNKLPAKSYSQRRVTERQLSQATEYVVPPEAGEGVSTFFVFFILCP
jgi:hypothetical protein